MAADEQLFGWDPTPGIVSVWADRTGRALVWQRQGGRVVCTRDRFRPWLLAASLDDLAHLGPDLVPDVGPNLGPNLETDVGPNAGPTLIPNRRPGQQDPRARVAVATYRELQGPPDRHRFLLAGHSGRALEAALLAGASRRLGRRVASVHELEDDYYVLGPVEQYLVCSGRVYFRGLTYADLHRMQIDLETTALDPARGRIFLAAVHDSRGLALTLEAPTPADEPRLIRELCTLVRGRDPDIIENHNLFGFDLPFLEHRAQALGVALPLARAGAVARMERYRDPTRGRSGRQRMRYSIAGRELIDTLDAVRRHDFVARDLPTYGLKDVARHFGVAAADRTYLAGADIYPTYRRDPATVRRYALDDVREVDALSQRLMGATFALAGMAPRRYERVASAGPAMGILEPLLVRSYVRASAGPPRRAARDGNGQEPHAGGALHLFATGVARHVVKADIASLYPSLMRAYRIGPDTDALGALLHVVDRLTDLRLAHKTAARIAAPGSPEAGHHSAMQAAMKLVINSAYGYMGAGRMALFADRRAADEVTRRGREILGQVLAGLDERGVALIEADTDGVFFAVPSSWDEARERALVADVAATLPDGVVLEYEGRYRAMLSHEVKNYALLTYGGELVLRGVALRSRRAERFGERFLAQALRHVLVGDIEAVHRIYRATVEAIRTRALPAADMATSVRLSKSPEQYRASRSAHREAAYEALLAAGRQDWQPGERVRCYRAADGRQVWLPDHAEDRRDYDVEHYLHTLITSYAARLRKAFAPADFDQLFRPVAQIGLFDRPVAQIQPLWIRCAET